MFGFINSLVLPFLAAALIPLIIYLFRRRKVKHIPFSSLRFLKDLENQHIRNLRIYQILLLLIRMAFIIFLVLAFARPALKIINISGTSAASTTAVVIVDDSYSMKTYNNSRTGFEDAVRALKNILSSFSEDDKVYILSTKGSGSQVQIHSTPDNLTAGNHLLPLDKLLDEAEIIFNQYPNLNKELYFLTDNYINRHALTDSIPQSFRKNEIKNYIIISSTQSVSNVSIDTAIIINKLFEINQPVTFEVHLTNHDINSPVTVHMNLFNHNKRMAMAQKQLEPAEKGTIQIQYSPRKSGQQIIHFELDDDDLISDNYYYLDFQIPKQIKILFVDQAEIGLLDQAFNAISQGSVMNIEKSTYSDWQGKQFRQYDLIVLNNPQNIQQQTISRLSEYLDQGKNIVIIPGDRITPVQLNTIFKKLTGKEIFSELIKALAPDQYFLLEDKFYQIDLFSAVFQQSNQTPQIPQVYKYFKIINSTDNIISLTNNDPFLTRLYHQTGQGKIYTFSSQLEPAWTNFPFQGLYIPILYRILYSAGYSSEKLTFYSIGQTIQYFPPNLSTEFKYTLHPPGNDPYPVNVLPLANGPCLVIDNPDKPGHYILYANNKLEKVFSVNLSSKELERPYLDLSETVFSNSSILTTNEIDSGQLKKARIGQELWLIFLLLAILMLALEIWLVKIVERGGHS